MRQGKVITNDDAARLHEDLLKQVEDIFELCTSGMHANGGATRDARKIQVSHRQCIPGRPSASAWCGLYSKQHPLGQNSSSPGGGACTVPMSSSSSSARIHGHHRRQCIYTGNALTHVCPGMKTVEPRVAGHPGVQAPPQSQLLTGYGGAGELTGDAKVRRAHGRCQGEESSPEMPNRSQALDRRGVWRGVGCKTGRGCTGLALRGAVITSL